MKRFLLVFAVLFLITTQLYGQGLEIGGGGNMRFPAAGCANTTASPAWDLPTSSAATAACATGSNNQKGVLNFTNGQSAQNHFYLPSGVVNAALVLIWSSAQTSSTGTWALTAVCNAIDGTTTDDAAYTTFWAPSGPHTSPSVANRVTVTTGNGIAFPASCTGGNKWMNIKLTWSAGTATSFDMYWLDIQY